MSDGSPQRDRIVLNANVGRTNVMDFEEFHDIAVPTLENIVDMILPLCGPKAMTNLVVYEHIATNMLSNVFSNDGIHILKSVEYLSPIQEFLVNYVKYVAERVDQAAGDGTSTAIYLTSRILARALTIVNHEIRDDQEDPVWCDINDLKERMDEVALLKRHLTDKLTELRKGANDLKIDLKDLDDDTRKTFIHSLAYTTSKGDELLSTYAVELFNNLPELLYEQTQFHRSQVETEDPLKIEYPEHDAQLAVKASANTCYNTDLNTVWSYEDADLLPVTTSINNNTVGELLEFIDERQQETNRPLLILINGIDESCQSKLERAIDPEKIALARVTNYHPSFVNNPTELRVILAMAGKATGQLRMVQDYRDAVISGLNLIMDYKELRIFNLIPSKDGYLHPYYQDPIAHQPYTDLRLELEEQIINMKASHHKKSYITEINEFTRIYRMMICSRLPILLVGGATVDHLSMVNVVEDVLGVVSVAMKHGVVTDMVPKLHYLADDEGPFDLELEETFCDLWTLTYQTDADLDTTLVGGVKQFGMSLKDLTFNQESFTWELRGKPTTVQSIKAIDETFDRLIETLPKLISTDKIIVPNSVVNEVKNE